MSWRDTLSPDVWTEYFFSGLLACGLVFIHRRWRSKERMQFLVVTIASAAAAAVFTHLFFTIIFPLGASGGFIFDIAVLAILTPLLLSGVHDRIFLEEKIATETLRAKEAENTALTARYEALKARISPHFLFNSLNTLADLVEEDPKLATTFIDQMAVVYRYILECQNAVSVPLDKELDAARALLFVLETRHSDALKISTPEPEETRDFEIAPLALQSLVENALKHNIYSPDQPLKISIRIEGRDLVVENTVNAKPGAISFKSGLDDLKDRFSLISDRPLRYGELKGCYWVRVPLVSGRPR